MSRPSRLWKDLPPETRLAAALAFWRDPDDSAQEAGDQHVEATIAIARRLNFRAKSVQALPIERKAKHLAQLVDVSDAIATRALVAYHFTSQRPMMAAFLDALGLAHDNGMITAEQVTPPEAERLRAAVDRVTAAFPESDVTLYLRTLSALDEDTWKNLDAVLLPSH